MIEHMWPLPVGDSMNINTLYFIFITFYWVFMQMVFVSEVHAPSYRHLVFWTKWQTSQQMPGRAGSGRPGEMPVHVAGRIKWDEP